MIPTASSCVKPVANDSRIVIAKCDHPSATNRSGFGEVGSAESAFIAQVKTIPSQFVSSDTRHWPPCAKNSSNAAQATQGVCRFIRDSSNAVDILKLFV